MEATTAVVQKSSGIGALVIILVIVVLVGGVGAWFVLKPKTDDKTPKDPKNDNVNNPGREDLSNQNPGLSKEDIERLFGNKDYNMQNPSTGSGGSGGDGDKPLFVYHQPAQDLINAKAMKFQENESIMDVIRAKYDIGRTLVQENSDVLPRVFELMMKVQGVDIFTNPNKAHLTFPIYGTLEPTGKEIRAKLQKFVDTPLGKLNLSNAREASQPWWIEDLSINLLTGSNTHYTPSADEIWWEDKPHLRPALDFYKAFNTHHVRDQWLCDMWSNGAKTNSPHAPGVTGGYNAGHMVFWVKKWIAEIDRLDKVCKWEALRTLGTPVSEGGDGWKFTYINPNNNAPSPEVPNPKDQYTSNSTTIINV